MYEGMCWMNWWKNAQSEGGMDAQYAAALARGDMKAAQGLVDAAAKAAGFETIAFHGSPDTDIEEFSVQRTAHGYYFSPDPDTASYYEGNGGRLYRVAISMGKTLDLTEDFERLNFFENFMSTGNDKVRMKMNKWHEKTEADTGDFAEAVFAYWNEDAKMRSELEGDMRDVLDGWKDENGQLSEKGLHSAIQEYFDYESLEDVLAKSPQAKEIIDANFPEEDREVSRLESAYGSQDFYMNEQTEVMQTAEANGYDSVLFDDPSPSGESVSYVVFDPRRIRIADAVVKDAEGNVIPLSRRFP